MKQTKSALTMLLAHYRAIYKHAILAAFVAASTLGVANAASPNYTFSQGNLDGFTGTVNGNDTFSSTDGNLVEAGGFAITQASGDATYKADKQDLKIKTKGVTVSAGNMIITGDTSAGNKIVSFDLSAADGGKGTFTLAEGANLKFTDNTKGVLEFTNASVDIKGTITANTTGQSTINLRAKSDLTIDSDKLKTYLNASSSGNEGKLVLNEATSVLKLTGAKVILDEIIGNAAGKVNLTAGDLNVADAQIKANIADASGANLIADQLTLEGAGAAFAAKTGFKTVTVSNILATKADAETTLTETIILDTSKASTQAGTGTITGQSINLGDAGIFDIKAGAWSTVAPIKLSHANAKLNIAQGASLESTGKLDVAANVSLDLKGNATFASLAVGNDNTLTIGGALATAGTLTITGTEAQTDLTFTGTGKVDVNGGKLTIGLKAVDELFGTDGTAKADKLGKITLTQAGLVTFTVDNSYTLDQSKKEAIIKAMGSGADHTADGFVKFEGEKAPDVGPDAGGALDKFDSTAEPIKDKGYLWATVKDKVGPVVNEKLEKAVIQVENADNTTGVKGYVGSFFVNDAATELKIADTTSLNSAASNTHNGKSYFVSNYDSAKKTVTAGNVDLSAQGKTLALVGDGEIGNIKIAEGTGPDATTTLAVKDGKSVVVGDIKAGTSGAISANTSASFTNTNVTAGDIIVESISTDNAVLNANSLETKKITSKNNNMIIKNDITLDLTGKTDAKDMSVVDGSLIQANNLKLKVDSTALTNGTAHLTIQGNGKYVVNNTLTVEGGNDANAVINVGSAGEKGTNGSLYVKDASTYEGAINVQGGVTGQSSTLVVGGNTIVKGNVTVGDNAVYGFGFDSQDEFVNGMKEAGLMDASGSLVADANGKKQAQLVVDTQMKVDGTKGSVTIGKPTTPTAAGNMSLGDGSSVVITSNATSSIQPGKSIIQVDDTHKVNVEGASKVIFAGGQTIDKIEGVKVFGDASANANVLDGSKGTLTLTNENGVLAGTIDMTTGIAKDVHVDTTKLSSAYTQATKPIQNYLATFFEMNSNVGTSNSQVAEYTQAITGTNGQDLEQAARYAVYGGSFKALDLAKSVAIDAVSSYLGGSANIAKAQADKVSLFVMPSYKSSDTDSYDVDGKEYGADVSLGGVAVGLDMAASENIKVGALFNIGSGSADGQGLGSGVNNDFDYYGFGVYTSFTNNNFEVTADVNYTTLSSDLSSDVTTTNDAKFNKLSAKADSKAVSFGVNATYNMDFDSTLVAPYAGARITQYSFDSYTVKVNGNDFVDNSFDDMTVVSVPVGVKLGTNFTSGDWMLQPSLDLGVTFNLGDTDMEHSAKAVTKLQDVALASEVIDDIVFGINAGIKAQYNSLSLGFGLGYEAGSNASDMSVNATARYKF